MEQKKEKMKFHLNLFDAMVMIVALAVGAVILWQMLDQNSSTTLRTTQVQYAITIKEASGGTGDLIPVGSSLTDAVKNYDLGVILSKEVYPAEKQVLNHFEHEYQTAYLEGYEDIVVELLVDVTETSTELVIDGGYELRVGDLIYMRGAGYMAAGYITRIDRLD